MIWLFLSGIPPNATNSSVFSTIEGQLVEWSSSLVEITHYVRYDGFRRGEAVAADAAGIASDAIEEAPHLALHVVELTGARPSVGSGVNRGVSELRTDALQLVRNQALGIFPTYADERVRATSLRAGARTGFEPALANHRRSNSRRTVQDACYFMTDRRRVAILFEIVKRLYCGRFRIQLDTCLSDCK